MIMPLIVAPSKACVFVEMAGGLMVSALDSILKQSGFELCSCSMSCVLRQHDSLSIKCVTSARVILQCTTDSSIPFKGIRSIPSTCIET